MGTVINIDTANAAAATKQRRDQQEARTLLLSAAVESGDSVTAINMLAGLLAAEHPGDEQIERVVAFLSGMAKQQAVAIAMSEHGIAWRRAMEISRVLMATWPETTADVVEAAHDLIAKRVAVHGLSLAPDAIDEVALAVGDAWERAQ